MNIADGLAPHRKPAAPPKPYFEATWDLLDACWNVEWVYDAPDGFGMLLEHRRRVAKLLLDDGTAASDFAQFLAQRLNGRADLIATMPAHHGGKR